MADIVVVLMLRSFRKWNSGETAGFPPEQAAALVNQGAAQYVKAPKAEEPEEAPETVVQEEPEEEVEAEAEEEVGADTADVKEGDIQPDAEVEAEAEEEVTVEIERRNRRLWLVYSDGREDEGPYTRRNLRDMGYDV